MCVFFYSCEGLGAHGAGCGWVLLCCGLGNRMVCVCVRVLCAGGCGIVDPHSVEEALQRGGQVPQHAGQSITSTLRASSPKGLANTHTHVMTRIRTHWLLELCVILFAWCHRLPHPWTVRYLKTTSSEMYTHASKCEFLPLPLSWCDTFVWMMKESRSFLTRNKGTPNTPNNICECRLSSCPWSKSALFFCPFLNQLHAFHTSCFAC